MGYDIKRFDGQDINEEFICSICQDVLQDPLLVDTCEHVFCRLCLGQWLDKSELKCCPIDRNEVNAHSLRPPQRSFRNMITSLIITCDYESNGCQERVKIEELASHSAKCPFNPSLMNQTIQCPTECGAVVKRCELNRHDCVQYLKSVITAKEEIIKSLQIECTNLRQTNDLKDMICLKDEIINRLQAENNRLVEEKTELRKQNESLMACEDSNRIDSRVRHRSPNNALTDRFTPLNQICAEINSNLDINSIASDCIESIETSVENRQLIEALKMRGFLNNERVMTAMLTIDRGLFGTSVASYSLHHIRSIGYGAHTGPSTYEAKMLQYLEPQLTPNCKVLDIGSGSGYIAACIAVMIKPGGRVVGIDHIPQLVSASIETIEKHYPDLIESSTLKMATSDGRYGFASEAPFDLIFVEALTRRVPQKLLDQLRAGGCIIAPIGCREKDVTLEKMTKLSNGDIIRLELCNDWKLMKENTLDLFDDKKSQLRLGWKVKLGF